MSVDDIIAKIHFNKPIYSVFFYFTDIQALAFTPTAGTYPDFIINTPANLASFTVTIKNAATGASNAILVSTGDNYAVDVYFAQANLATTPTGTKSAAFAATADSQDLKVALASAASLANTAFTANGVTLPATNCNLYKWLCACVKKGAGAHYVDAVTTNNCHCSDASAKISCSPGKSRLYIYISILRSRE
jgi:hypothetical protein